MVKIVALSNPRSVEQEKRAFSKYKDVVFVVSEEKDQDKVMELLRDADVILFSAFSITGEMIKELEKCKLIIRYGIGYDNIDIKKAAEKGIMVCNAPNYGVIDVAEHAMSLMLACSKRLNLMDDRVRNKCWNGSGLGKSSRIFHKTIGFVGFGKIARYVCECMNAFHIKAIVYDPYVSENCLENYHAKRVSLDTLLQEADYVTLHLPLNQDTYHMLGAKEFAKMKKTACIINTSRGGLICEKELIDALEQGVIAGAGLDVFETENSDLDERILKMKNVVLTPHVAWNTAEATEALHKEVTENVERFLHGGKPQSIVNM